MAIPLVLLAGKALFSLGVRVLGKKVAQATLKKGGDKGLQKLILKTQKSKSPKQKEMFNDSGTVKASVKKSNEALAARAKKVATAKKRQATLQAKKDAAKRRADGAAKGKATRAKNKETAAVAAKTAARKKTAGRAVTAASVGATAAALSKSPSKENKTTKATTNSLFKSRVPAKKAASQTPSEAKAMLERKRAAAKKGLTAKEKFLAKRAAKKVGTPRDRTLRNQNKRLKDRKY